MKKWFYPLGLVTLLGFAALFLTFTRDEMIKFDRNMAELLGDNAFITVFSLFRRDHYLLSLYHSAYWHIYGLRSKNYRGMLFVLFAVGVGNVINQLLKEMGTARTSRRATSTREL